MLEIHECRDNSAYKKQLDMIDCDDAAVVEAFENGENTGYGIYSLSPFKVIIYDFSDTDNLYLLDGIIRAMLFKACLKNIYYAVFDIKDENKKKLLEALSLDDEIESLSDFFSGCKNCK